MVKLLESSLELNRDSFEPGCSVSVQQLLWDRTEQWPKQASYDLILGADVVYLEDLHLPLLDMMARVLAPGGGLAVDLDLKAMIEVGLEQLPKRW